MNTHTMTTQKLHINLLRIHSIAILIQKKNDVRVKPWNTRRDVPLAMLCFALLCRVK